MKGIKEVILMIPTCILALHKGTAVSTMVDTFGKNGLSIDHGR
jgi:hypothetical protein